MQLRFLTGCTSERSDARDWICGHPSELYTWARSSYGSNVRAFRR